MAQPQKGFTLVEMMVGISIISLLSSVVLSSVNDTREKFRSAQMSSNVEEYRKAFAIGYDKYGGYPQGTQSGPSSYCLGSSPSCGSSDPVVNAVVLESLPSLPPAGFFKYYWAPGASPMYGPSYQYYTCTSNNGSTDNKNACSTASIHWWSSPGPCSQGTGYLFPNITPSIYSCTLILA